MASKILKKLTIREAVGGKPALQKIVYAAATPNENGLPTVTPGKPVEILQIIGFVQRVVAGESDNGPYMKLHGEFEAVNLVTGEVFSDVGTAILPNFLGDRIANAIKAGADNVQFGVKILAHYEETAATGYVFTAETLMTPQKSRNLEAIKSMILGTGNKLAGPPPIMLTQDAPEAAGVNKAPAALETAPAAATPAPAQSAAPAESPAPAAAPAKAAKK